MAFSKLKDLFVVTNPIDDNYEERNNRKPVEIKRPGDPRNPMKVLSDVKEGLKDKVSKTPDVLSDKMTEGMYRETLDLYYKSIYLNLEKTGVVTKLSETYAINVIRVFLEANDLFTKYTQDEERYLYSVVAYMNLMEYSIDSKERDLYTLVQDICSSPYFINMMLLLKKEYGYDYLDLACKVSIKFVEYYKSGVSNRLIREDMCSSVELYGLTFVYLRTFSNEFVGTKQQIRDVIIKNMNTYFPKYVLEHSITQNKLYKIFNAFSLLDTVVEKEENKKDEEVSEIKDWNTEIKLSFSDDSSDAAKLPTMEDLFGTTKTETKKANTSGMTLEQAKDYLVDHIRTVEGLNSIVEHIMDHDLLRDPEWSVIMRDLKDSAKGIENNES